MGWAEASLGWSVLLVGTELFDGGDDLLDDGSVHGVLGPAAADDPLEAVANGGVVVLQVLDDGPHQPVCRVRHQLYDCCNQSQLTVETEHVMQNTYKDYRYFQFTLRSFCPLSLNKQTNKHTNKQTNTQKQTNKQTNKQIQIMTPSIPFYYMLYRCQKYF